MPKQQPTGYINPVTHEFVPAVKKRRRIWPWIVGVIVIMLIYGALGGNGNKAEPSDAAREKPAETEKAAPEETETAKEETEPKPEEPKETEAPEEGPLPAGTYDAAGLEMHYDPTVRNDTTGKWRVATCIGATVPEESAREIAEALGLSSGEVLWIVNLSLSTTTRITHFGAILDVATTEYVKGEEHDAALLGSGALLSSSTISLTEAEP